MNSTYPIHLMFLGHLAQADSFCSEHARVKDTEKSLSATNRQDFCSTSCWNRTKVEQLASPSVLWPILLRFLLFSGHTRFLQRGLVLKYSEDLLLPPCYQDRTQEPDQPSCQEHHNLWSLVGLGCL